MIVFEVILVCTALLVLLPVLVLFAQVLLAMWPRSVRQITGLRPSLAVLIPAHNEASVIADTLAALLPQLSAGDRIVVIADNCTDNTAEIAVAKGVEVIMRMDDERHGKSYALDFGVRHISYNPPEVAIIIDADCKAHNGSLDTLSRMAFQLKQSVQALDLMTSPPDAGLKSQISEFAWLVKNHVRPLGYQQLGFPCQLMGTGMAFPWQALSEAKLASGHIVEDLKLGLDLACAGTFTFFCPEALVTSVFPSNEQTITAQRTRWEHGHLLVILSELPRVLKAAIQQRSIGLLVLALDLCVPPLALLSLLIIVLLLISLSYYAVSASSLALVIAFTESVMFGIAILLSWLKYGRQVISFSNLARIPAYILWKIPLYLKFLVNKQVSWVKTKR
ncbi:MAG: glycosyltransferase [Methylovulum sp.]|nr:glycosyltransferase [Methylovulum sp.]MCF8007148.1 glycosyltransferase [Methylovulum sp.]